MTLPNSLITIINNLATAISDKITNTLETHENKTSSSTQKGHSQAGSAPQTIGTSLSAGTDNGYYARADHVHTVDYSNVLNKPNVIDNLTTDSGSSPLSAKQGKWLNENKASTSHEHSQYLTSSDVDLEYDDTTGILKIKFL